MREFKDLLRQVMDERQLKSVDICRLTGLGSGAVSQYLSGKRTPKLSTIELFSKALNISETWLLGLDVPQEREPEIVRRQKQETLMEEMSRRFLKEMNDFYLSSDFGTQVSLYESFKKWQEGNKK